jgi:hypothetical protein
MTTAVTTGGRNLVPHRGDRLLSEQGDARSHLAALVQGLPDEAVVSVRVGLIRPVLAPGLTDSHDDGLALTAAAASARCGLSGSRLKRLTRAGLAPGAWREPGPKGEWRWPIASLRALEENRRRGLHRGVGRRPAEVAS